MDSPDRNDNIFGLVTSTTSTGTAIGSAGTTNLRSSSNCRFIDSSDDKEDNQDLVKNGDSSSMESASKCLDYMLPQALPHPSPSSTFQFQFLPHRCHSSAECSLGVHRQWLRHLPPACSCRRAPSPAVHPRGEALPTLGGSYRPLPLLDRRQELASLGHLRVWSLLVRAERSRRRRQER